MKRQININIKDASSETREFKGLRALLSFLHEEVKYWKDKYEQLEDIGKDEIHGYIKSYSSITGVIENINKWNETKRLDDERFTHYVTESFNNIQRGWLWHDHPYSSAFVQCNRENGTIGADAFINFVFGNEIGRIDNKNKFFGALKAYEFLHQKSDILKRRKTEKVALERVRQGLINTKNELYDEVEDFKTNFNSWGEETQQKWANLQQQASEEHSKEQTRQREEFSSYMNASNAKILELENTYQKKLQLSEPAKYWKKIAKKFTWQGVFWSILLIGSLVGGIYFLYEFYIGWLQEKEKIWMQLNTIQGIVISIAILTVYAFLLRVLSRLTFSTFHLMRDAGERHQLTYFYLSLIKEEAIEEKSRDLVIQALFSRTETGLLPKESGPIMPGMAGIVNPDR